MLYRSHLAAGAAAGTVAAAAAGLSGAPEEQWLAIGGLCLGFALLPDLDVASVVQRWFYRIMLALLVLWICQGRLQQAAVLGAVCLLPLVDHHRGWMHAWWAALLVPLASLALWDIAAGGNAAAGGLAVRLSAALAPGTIASFAREVMTGRVWYLAAMIAGYSLHLTLDHWNPARLRRPA